MYGVCAVAVYTIYMNCMKFLGLFIFCMIPFGVNAQEVHQELQETVRAEVQKIIHEEERDIIGTDTTSLVQEVLVEVQGGERKREKVSFETDLMKLEVGDSIYINRLVGIDGVEYFAFKDIDRSMPLLGLVVCFAALLIIFAGRQGFRALMSLCLSIAILFFVLVPLLLSGYPPVWVSVLVAGPMLAGMLFLTHGVHSRVWIAFLGTFGAVIVTSVMTIIWVSVSRFTGLSSDAAIYLNFSTQGSLDFGGLLLGSIIIGMLGVLDDVAITQASVVGELKRANASLSFRELYTRGIRVGRDHVGSLVNTLAFAYIGASLPLVLLLMKAQSGIVLSLNQEMVAVELVRIFVGSIGLILAVPLTTLIASLWYKGGVEGGESAVAHTHHH